tara:strand:- start:7897 stop:8091 length:195 start_codon:yes stop_codon:yes gene_type:complete
MIHRCNVEKAYKKLEDLTLGAAIGTEDVSKFVATLDRPEQAKANMHKLTLHNYISNAAKKANSI